MSRVYFTDRDLGKQFPDTLRAAGLTVERHADFFSPTGSDEEWLEYCGAKDRIALSHNLRIRYTPNELAAVTQHGVALIILIGKVPLPSLADNFVNTMGRIESFVDRHQPPFIAKVYRPSPSELNDNPKKSGTIKLWYPKELR